MTKNVGGDKLLAFLCELMTSPVVKRCVKMLVKRFSTIMTPGGDKHVSVHHFNASGEKNYFWIFWKICFICTHFIVSY